MIGLGDRHLTSRCDQGRLGSAQPAQVATCRLIDSLLRRRPPVHFSLPTYIATLWKIDAF